MKKNKTYLLSLIDIFAGNLPKIQNLTDNKKTNYTINTMEKQEAIEEILSGLSESEKLKVLEKLAMKIRKANSIKINKVVDDTRGKYPKK